MKKNKFLSIIGLIIVSLGIGAVSANGDVYNNPEVKARNDNFKRIKRETKKLEDQKSSKEKELEDLEDEIELSKKSNVDSKQDIEESKKDQAAKIKKYGISTNSNKISNSLAKQNYQSDHEIAVNGGNPDFSKVDLDTKKGAWQTYSNLDQLNRVGKAEALLNISLMPKNKRSALTWNPTGWHNKKINGGWLYNRSHLIGYQLTGENNNPKNLMTGTRQLNNPYMLMHEMDIAYYLKKSSNNFVRYRVTPIFRGDELLARGVQLEAKSIGDNQINFNYYIFNAEDGVELNYADGTSIVK